MDASEMAALISKLGPRTQDAIAEAAQALREVVRQHGAAGRIALQLVDQQVREDAYDDAGVAALLGPD